MNKSTMEEQLSKGKILPLLLRLAAPITIAQIVNALYNIVDRIYIGQMPGVGSISLTGLGLTLPVIMMITAFSNLIGMGGAPLLSIRMGAGDKETAGKLEGNSLTLLLMIGAAITVIGIVFCEPIMVLFGASPDSLPYAVSYLRIYLIGTIPVMISLGMNSFLNAQGLTFLGTMTIAIGAVVNIILDPIFIYVFHMGIAGAALASVIAQTISALWVLYSLNFSKKITIKLKWSDLIVTLKNVKAICSLGVSTFIFSINESLIQIYFIWLLRLGAPDIPTGDAYIGALAIISSLNQVFFMPLKGIVQGAQPIVGYCYGAKNYKRLHKAINYARVCSIVCATVLSGIMLLFPGQVARLFTSDTVLIGLCHTTIRLYFCMNFVIGMQMVNQNMFIAMGNTKYSFFFGIFRKVLLGAPFALIFTLIFGVYGVFMAEPVSNTISVVVTYIVFSKFMKKVKAECEAVSPGSEEPGAITAKAAL
ncbi:MATE family efflux transporter [Anaerolentibacter hominis]|uniref:MATE family efflux transporter n=1 Tax=Anaerolentibacter hominis TaxID=3079009 RepID=UPI0031B83C6B